MHRPIVIADMPRCGLGNKMLVWARGLIFAKEFDLPFYTFGWEQLNIGPLLRGEKSNRYYGGYFQKNGSVWGRAKIKRAYKRAAQSVRLTEPDLKNIKGMDISAYQYVVFNRVPEWNDYFGDIHHHRQLVRDAFMNMVKPSLLKLLDRQPAPGIGLHIRLGDFREPREGESFKETGGIRTPMSYFTEVVNKIRDIAGEEIPATIFTNGKDAGLKEILKLPNIAVAPKNPDIIDLLLLARSRVIVTSARSTFGYWSGFFSEAPIILHPDHLFGSIRSKADGEKYYEGPLSDPCPALLKKHLIAPHSIPNT
ncbi:MAG TPA: hypothetical protein ENJ20_00600 [Bacteroidetes bacterium]|nr:hypothetical protein [Bacteroidota bacterium]